MHRRLRCRNWSPSCRILGFANVKIREPSFSLLSKPDNPRTQLKVVFEAHTSELEILVKLSAMRGLHFGADAYYGLQGMVGADDTFILEAGNAANVRHYWAVCSQLVALSAKRYLIQTAAEPEAWTAIMNAVLGRDAEDTTAKLKYKASVRGGRTIAAPAATTGALAAARRGGNRQITSADCVAEVSVAGEIGYEDQAVLGQIMDHLASRTGLALTPAADALAPKLGEYYAEPGGRAGSLKVLLGTLEDARRVYAALDGRTMEAGEDRLIVKVNNDAIDGRAVPGGRLRRQ